MKVYQSAGRLGLLLLLVSSGLAVRAQTGPASYKKLAYNFVSQYFHRMRPDSPLPYRLAVRRLPVVSPYADHFDLRNVLSANFLTTNQFISRVRVDSLLAPDDFAAMRRQLRAWRLTRRWRAGRLRAAGVVVLTHDRRTLQQRLAPDFITYQVFPPLFSRNGQLALFYVVTDGGGQVNLLQQQPGGSWKFVLGVPIFVV